jgi:hypothetical protein
VDADEGVGGVVGGVDGGGDGGVGGVDVLVVVVMVGVQDVESGKPVDRISEVPPGAHWCRGREVTTLQ